MKITVVADLREDSCFQGEFGLALLLETDHGRYLFDTGAGGVLVPNLRRMGISPDSVRKVILSHGHYDHTGGLSVLGTGEIWCCDGILDGHFSRHSDGSVHCISMPDRARRVFSRSRIHWIESFQTIAPGMLLTGPIPRVSGEDCGGDFYRDEACGIADAVSEEQALLTSDGMLITGCCHAGIVNTLLYCRKIHPEIQIRSIAGGLHLRNAGMDRLEHTAEFLREAGIRTLYLLHCTGKGAVEYLSTVFFPECRVPLPGESFPSSVFC